MWKFEFQDKVKCIITGFSGKIVGRLEYMNGCIQYEVSPRIAKDGSHRTGRWIDEQSLKLVKKSNLEEKRRSLLGGPPRGPVR